MIRLTLALSLALVASPALAQESALPALREAARANARDYDAQVALGRALLDAGRYREASATLRRAARLRRNDPAALGAFLHGHCGGATAHDSSPLPCDRLGPSTSNNAPRGKTCVVLARYHWRRSCLSRSRLRSRSRAET